MRFFNEPNLEYIQDLIDRDKENNEIFFYGISQCYLKRRWNDYYSVKTKWFRVNNLYEFIDAKEKIKSFVIEKIPECLKEDITYIDLVYYLVIKNRITDKEHKFKFDFDRIDLEGGIK